MLLGVAHHVTGSIMRGCAASARAPVAPVALHRCVASHRVPAPRTPALRAARAPGTERRWCAAAAQGDNGADNFTVTTPLYYVNASPHMGSAYPTMAADAIARFHRLTGKQVKFITGTDEHGEKIAQAAEAQGLTPQEHCDGVVSSYKSLWGSLDIQYDSFIRTTDPLHETVVKQALERAWEKGDIYKASYEGFYCVGCEEYKDEGDLADGNVCPTHRTPCQHRSEENYFFKLSAYQNEIEALVSTPGFVMPESRRNEVMGWVRDGLRDFSVSRANVEWGIPVPRDPDQTVYVWFDALNGYISGLFQGSGEAPSLEGAAAQGWPASLHLIGKDILRFHAIYWPAMLLSAGMEPPQAVFGHGFLTKDGLKMGKSLGNVLDPVALVEAYGADAVRYYFLKEVPFGSDGDFSEERFRYIVNADLANGIGNLLNRSLNLVKKNCDAKAPMAAAEVPEGHPMREAVAAGAAEARRAYAEMEFGKALNAVMGIVYKGNAYIDEKAPWTALKKGTEEEAEEARGVLLSILEALRVVSVLLSPVTPTLSSRMAEQLALPALEGGPGGAAGVWDEAVLYGGPQGIKAGHEFPKPKPVFARLEGDMVTEPAATPAAAGA
ncbi:unnamed protein product [Pedinophyceae sp. YPF-701]|nr:unnamed protein product [Pedinophyceae sp. YPF-701]